MTMEIRTLSRPTNSDFNELISRLTPREFEVFVFEIFAATMPFYNLERERGLGGTQIDLLAEPTRSAEPQVRPVAFEIKKTPVVSADLILAQVGRRKSIRKVRPDCDFVLVIGGVLRDTARKIAQEHNLIVWDAEQLRSRVADDIWSKWTRMVHPHQQQRAAAPENPATEPNDEDTQGGDEPNPNSSKSDSLLTTLQNIPPGDDGALDYQRWVADALEFLFVPLLGPLHYESSDLEKRNRRDVILENWAESGFWAQIRTIYAADQIVVDAKNSAKPLTKRPVVDIAHYLKPYGCGLSGVLCCRIGADGSAKHAIREQWIGGRKLIIVLSDETMTEMLTLKAAGGQPEELLRRQIATFRKLL